MLTDYKIISSEVKGDSIVYRVAFYKGDISEAPEIVDATYEPKMIARYRRTEKIGEKTLSVPMRTNIRVLLNQSFGEFSNLEAIPEQK